MRSAAGAVAAAVVVTGAGAATAGVAAAAKQHDHNDEPDAGIVFKTHGSTVHLTSLILHYLMWERPLWKLDHRKKKKECAVFPRER